MEIRVIWHGDRFNIELAGTPAADPFLVIKGCKIVQGEKGEFVSGPAWKNNEGKWINHTYMGPKFQEAVIAKAKEAQPKAAPPQRRTGIVQTRQPQPSQGSGFDDFEDAPF